MRDVGKALGVTFARIRELEKATNPKHLEDTDHDREGTPGLI